MQLSTIEMMINVCLVSPFKVEREENKSVYKYLVEQEHANDDDDGNYSTRNLLLTIISNFTFNYFTIRLSILSHHEFLSSFARVSWPTQSAKFNIFALPFHCVRFVRRHFFKPACQTTADKCRRMQFHQIISGLGNREKCEKKIINQEGIRNLQCHHLPNKNMPAPLEDTQRT